MIEHDGRLWQVVEVVSFEPATIDAEARLSILLSCCKGRLGCERCDGSGIWDAEFEGETAEEIADELLIDHVAEAAE